MGKTNIWKAKDYCRELQMENHYRQAPRPYYSGMAGSNFVPDGYHYCREPLNEQYIYNELREMQEDLSKIYKTKGKKRKPLIKLYAKTAKRYWKAIDDGNMDMAGALSRALKVVNVAICGRDRPRAMDMIQYIRL